MSTVAEFSSQIVSSNPMNTESQRNFEQDLLETVLNSGLLGKQHEETEDKYNSEASQDSDDMTQEQKIERLRRKPDELRRQLFEIVLRKRIFLTDRMEKIEKILVKFGFIQEKDLANQQTELLRPESITAFKELIRSKLSDIVTDDTDEQCSLSYLIDKLMETQAEDDQWYELYKSVTNDKDMAERD